MSAQLPGPTTTIDIAHRINNDVSLGRSSSAAEAIRVAPVVENGETSTIEAHTLKALMSAQPATPPDVASGTASGTNAASIPVGAARKRRQCPKPTPSERIAEIENASNAPR